MKRLISVSSLCVLATAAMALPAFLNAFKGAYKFPANSKLAAAKCMACHESKMGGKLNPYGMDVKKALAGSKNLTSAILHKIDNLDSDKDGVKNGDEIKQGRLPGVKG